MDLLSVLNARLSKWLHERMGVLECGCSGAVQRLVTDCKSFWLSLFPPRSHEPVCKQLPCGVGGVDSLPFFSHLIFMFSLLAHIRGPFFNVWLHVRAGTLVQFFFLCSETAFVWACVCVRFIKLKESFWVWHALTASPSWTKLSLLLPKAKATFFGTPHQ